MSDAQPDRDARRAKVSSLDAVFLPDRDRLRSQDRWMPDFRDSLHQHLAKVDVAPFLGVGAGLSIRYLGLDG